nr:hypothetical protein [Tanacetum cinerariifolium]
FVQGRANGFGPIAEHRDIDRGRQHFLQPGQFTQYAIHGLDDVRARLAEHHDVDPLLIAGPGVDVGVFRAVDHPRYVTQMNRGAILVGNDQLVIVLGLKQLVVGGQGGNAVLAVQRAFGQVQACLLQRGAQVAKGQANGRELFRRRLHTNRRASLAGDRDLANAVDLAQLSGQQRFGDVAQLGRGHQVGADAEN